MGKRLEKTPNKRDIPNGQKAKNTVLNSLIIREMYYKPKNNTTEMVKSNNVKYRSRMQIMETLIQSWWNKNRQNYFGKLASSSIAAYTHTS